jgi:chaperone LolA
VITSVTRPVRLVVSDLPAADAQDGAAILKRSAAAYAKVKSMRADFVQLRQNPLLGSNTTSRGTLYQRTPDRFALKFSQPAGDVIMADGRYFWVYYPSVERRQVIRAPATAAGAGAVDLHAQFIGDPVRRFRYRLEGTQKINGRSVHVLTLTPRADAGYQSLKVWIDAADALVRRFQITEPTGAVVEFQLSNVVINPTLGNDVFKFTPPANATIIER